jgi:hypothetical protein
MPKRIVQVTRPVINTYRTELKKQIITGITAAFAFLIALSWRDPISEFVNTIIDDLGLKGGLLFKFLSAIVVTLIAAIILVIVSKWASRDEAAKK